MPAGPLAPGSAQGPSGALASAHEPAVDHRATSSTGGRALAGDSMVPAHRSPLDDAAPTPSLLNATGWYEFGNPPVAPGGGAWRVFAYDPTLHGDLYFGGSGVGPYALPDNETWLFNASGWQRLFPSQSPPKLSNEMMAWDAADDEMVLFGGILGGYTLNFTWAFAAGTWTNISQSVAPPGLEKGVMFSDADDGSVVLFGGVVTTQLAGSSVSDATWTFRGGQWRDLPEASSPAARSSAAASWDSTAGAGVLFGGFSYLGILGWVADYDTWAFSHGSWSQLQPLASPSPRGLSAMGDDPALRGVVTFGGMDASGSVSGDTWLFAANNWTQFATATAPSAPEWQTSIPMEMATGPDGSSLIFYEPDVSNFNPETWEFSTLQPTIAVDTPVQEGTNAITFTVSVVGTTLPQNFTWKFGDNTSGIGATVSHAFPAPGSYQATVTVVDRSGRVANTSRNIWAYPPLVLSATLTPTVGAAPLTLRFDGACSGGDPPYALAWSSPAVGGISGDSGSLTLVQAGSYEFTVRGVDAGNYSAARSFQVTVLPASAATPLSAAVSSNVSGGPAPLAVTFAGLADGGTPPYSLAWRMSDGAEATGATVTRWFVEPGSYRATLTVTDARGDTSGASATVGVTQAFYVIASEWGEVANGSVALNASAFDGLAPYSFYWAWGDGSATTGDVGRHTFAESGAFRVELTGIDATGHLAWAWTNVSITVTPVTASGLGRPPEIPWGSWTLAVTVASAGGLGGGVAVLWHHRRRVARNSGSPVNSNPPARPHRYPPDVRK